MSLVALTDRELLLLFNQPKVLTYYYIDLCYILQPDVSQECTVISGLSDCEKVIDHCSHQTSFPKSITRDILFTRKHYQTDGASP